MNLLFVALGLLAHLFVIHLGVIGMVALGGALATWVKVGSAIMLGSILVSTYVLETMYALLIIRRHVRGRRALYLFLLGYFMVIWTHAAVFFEIELLWPMSFGAVPISLADSPFGAFYGGMFPLATGVFNTVGNASTYPIGVLANIWWVWTSIVGVLHIGFILSFLSGKFSVK